MEYGVLVGVFLAIGYFNVYVLLPLLLFKNQWIMYIVTVILIVTIPVLYMMPPELVEPMAGFRWIYMITSIAQITVVFVGTTAFVVFQHWARNERYITQLEESIMRAELEQLQNQINPHFLFNMLNNILVLVRENPPEAATVLHKLSDMLKYQFNDATKKEVLLKDDIRFLTDYLNLEKIRRDRFEFSITVDNGVENRYVPPLLFIPFVENAVKHSANASNLSYIRLIFSAPDDNLIFSCHNSKPAKPPKKHEFSGLGLINVRRRLDLMYSNNYSLNISEEDSKYIVQLSINN